MLVSHCPRCSEQVRVPQRLLLAGPTDGDVTIHCPWCSATLLGDEVFSRLPPALVLVGADGNVLADEPTDHRPVAGNPSNHGRMTQFSSDADDGFEEIGEFDVVEELVAAEPRRGSLGPAPTRKTPSQPDQEASEFVMMDVHSGRSRSSRRKSPIRSVIGVVLGGLASLPIVAGLLWVAGKPLPNLGFYPFDGTVNTSAPRARASMAVADPSPRRRDPIPVGRSLGDDLQAGPNEPDPAAAAVAEITSDMLSPDPAIAPESNAPSQPSSEPAAADSSQANSPRTLFDEPMMPKIELAPIKSAAKPPVDASPDFELLGIPQGAKLNTLEKAVPASDEPAIKEVMPASNDALAMGTKLPAELPASVSVAPPMPSPDEIMTSVEQDLTALESSSASDPAWKSKTASAYSNLSKLAASLPEAGGDAALIGQADAILARIKANGALVREFAMAAPAWIANSFEKRGTDGILAIGKLSTGAGQTSLTLGGGKTIPATLPADVPSTPEGIQIGLGTMVEQSGSTAIELIWLVPLR